MRRKRFTLEQIVGILRYSEVAQAGYETMQQDRGVLL
jgi:hypothetical protein